MSVASTGEQSLEGVVMVISAAVVVALRATPDPHS